MSTPPPKPPAPPSGERADLSHFRPKMADSAPPPKAKADLVGALAKKIGKPKIPKPPKPKSGSGKKVLAAAAVVLAVIVVALAAVVAPPLVARSSAFGAFEAGDYQRALGEFRAFLADHPNDADAAYHAALAAARTGDYDYAARVMGKIAGNSEFARNPEFIFAYALVLAPGPQTTAVLNKLVSVAPQHAGGRLLRGIMLTKEKDFSRAREDFLEADSILRGAQSGGGDLRAVHKRVAQNAHILPVFAAQSGADANSPAFQRFAARINAPAPDGLFINRYESVPPPAAADNYGDSDIVGFYYAAMLVLAEQFREAEVEFSKLPPDVAESAEVQNLQAVAHAVRGEYKEAADIFAEISGKVADAPDLILNLANASFVLNPTGEGAAAAAALYDKALAAAENPAPAALHNRAVLRLITGNIEGAQEDLAAIKDGAPAQTALLRVFAEFAQNPQSEKFNQLLKAAGNFSGTEHLRAARYAAEGRHNQALRLLAKNSESGGWSDAARAYVRYLADVRLFMRAYYALQARAPERAAETRYQSGALLLAAGNLPKAEETLQFMETENAEEFWTGALRGLVEHAKNNPEQALVHLTQAAQNARTDADRRQIAVDAADILLAAAPDLLEKILGSLQSPDPVAETLLARLRAKKDPDGAAKTALAAAARYPIFAVQYHASYALADAGRPDESLTLMLAAAEWNPVNVPLLNRVAELQTAAADPDGAEATKQRVAGIRREIAKEEKDGDLVLGVDSPADNKMIGLLTDVINKNASPGAALARFEELMEDASGGGKAKLLFQRGTFYYALRQYAEAERDLNGAMPELDEETRLPAMEYLAKTLEFQRKYGKAAEVFQQLAESRPGAPLYRRLAGRAMANYDPEKGAEYLAETTRLFPANLDSYFELSAVLQNAQKPQEAADILQKAARIAPLYAKIYAMLSRAQRSHNPEAAKENSVVASKLVL